MSDELNFRPPDGEPHSDARNTGATLEQLSELVDQIRTHSSRAQRRLDRIERSHESLSRYIQILWLVLGFVIVSFGVVLWYGIPIVIGPRVKPSAAETNPVSTPSPAPRPSIESNAPKAVSVKDAVQDVPADDIRRQRVDFHVGSNQTEQVAPGIYLTIKGTNIGHQQVNGWLRSARDGHIVWIRDQETQKYLTIESPSETAASFLVFTRVDSQGVAGYMMIPPSRAGD